MPPPLEETSTESGPNDGLDAALLQGDGGGDAEPGAGAKGRPQIPTMACIAAPMVLTLLAVFLIAALLPPAPAHADPPTQPSNASDQGHPSPRSDPSRGQLGETAALRSRNTPRGIHLALTGASAEMYVQFATTSSGKALVEISEKGDAATTPKSGLTAAGNAGLARVEGTSTTYSASDMCDAPATSTDNFFSPGNLHTVKVTGLVQDTNYEYRAGLGFGQGIQWSDKFFTFRTSPAPGATPPPSGDPALTFLAFADQGCPESTETPGANPAHDVTALVKSIVNERTVHSVHIVGGLSYADGVAHAWDTWIDLIQEYATAVPVTVVVGNHEYDHVRGGAGKDPSGVDTADGFQPRWGAGAFAATKGGECGVPVARRFAAPAGGNGVFWYSHDQALAHTVVLSSEHNMTFGSPQYVWLERDLAAVNRTVTPWLVVEMHRPFYNSAMSSHWQNLILAEGLQNQVEDLFIVYQVDLVISGHYRSYFRSCDGLYDYTCGAGGPTYVTVGTGGAPLDAPAEAVIPGPAQYTAVADHEHFGVGRASVFNATALRWEFVAVGGNVTDEVWLTRNPRR